MLPSVYARTKGLTRNIPKAVGNGGRSEGLRFTQDVALHLTGFSVWCNVRIKTGVSTLHWRVLTLLGSESLPRGRLGVVKCRESF